MNAGRFRILSLVVLGSLVTVAAQAGTIPSATFDWNPRPLKLNGSKFTADTLHVSDFGQVVVSPVDPATATSAFSEAGYLPVLGFALGGQAISPPGFNNPSHNGWGVYVEYHGLGTQKMTQSGIVARYSELTYSIYGFNGHADFGLDANGVAYKKGGTNTTLLGDGKLIGGSLTLVPTGFKGTVPVQFKASGDIQATVADVPHQFSSNTFLGFDLNIIHSPGEVFAGSGPGIIEAKGGSNSTATLIASHGNSALMNSVALVTPVPEPASALIFAAGLVPICMLRRRRR
ncbi:MAG TPA: PEP-CTERM sorting domain-containing protein [Acetobacteraceae bacterium]|nr:PEP-CTERM sorting domain-containing protein [Acetobacteraceae bacterium]